MTLYFVSLDFPRGIGSRFRRDRSGDRTPIPMQGLPSKSLGDFG
jgi:hypothetical protein